jgi:hypothetical protein
LSGLLEINQPAAEASRKILLEAMKDKILDLAARHVTCESPANTL